MGKYNKPKPVRRHLTKRKKRVVPNGTVIFHLRRFLNDEELDFVRNIIYKGNVHKGFVSDQETTPIIEQFKLGMKTVEYRDATPYWIKRLTTIANPEITNWAFFPRWNNKPEVADLTGVLKVHRVWLMEGYPKGNMPRLEGTIIGVWRSAITKKLGIHLRLDNSNSLNHQSTDE